MSPPGYRSILRGKVEESRFELRLQLVRYAQEQGIREAARAFRASRNTVRLWLRRYEVGGAGALVEQSRAPKRIPHKTSQAQERKIIAARQAVSCYGPRRLKQMFELKPSKNAIGRILKEAKLTRRKRKKREKQADLREAKAKYRALTHLQMDVKYLWDIPYFWPQMEALGLPRYEYTIRDTKSGATFLGFGQQLSVTYASILIRRCLKHLERCGIDPDTVTVQTDRGGEFSGGMRKKQTRGFVHTVRQGCGARHVFTPPRWPNANADVEAFHRLIEEELFDLECFAGLEDFLRKATLYQHYFNYARPNSYKGERTPWEIVERDHPDIHPEVLALPPVLLEAEFLRLDQVGQNVPGLDAICAHAA
jgi:transposase